ncbi:MAG TPA: hypothetical protein VMX13_07290 [Sedimentisphaerales bacterium]|nr:hypothetical protein [Sedimentisphaerales bacterium]
MKPAFIICLLATSLVSFCRGAEPAASAEEMRTLLFKGYTAAKTAMDDVRMIIEYKNETDPKWIEAHPDRDHQPETYTAEEYIRKHGKERWAFLYLGTASPPDGIADVALSVGTDNSPAYKVFDGQCILDYYTTAGSVDTETQRGRAARNPTDTGILAAGNSNPAKFLGYDFGAMPDDVLSSPHLTIEAQAEQVGDLPAFKVSAPIEINKVLYNLTYWLCPARCCLPVVAELRRTNGTLRKRMETTEFIQLENGRWAIKSVLQRNFVAEDGEPWEIQKHTFTIRTLQLNPEINDKIFSTSPDSLPPGTLFRDAVSGLEYVIGEGPISDERVKKLVTKALEDAFSEIKHGSDTGSAENQQNPRVDLQLDDVPNQPLFSDTGALPPATANNTHHTKTLALVWRVTAIALCLFLILATALIVRWRCVSIRRRNSQ